MTTLNTVALLLTQIERRSFAPANQASFSDTEILRLATEELNSKIIPEIIRVREEYYVAIEDQAITANQAGYSIPDRSFNSIVREVQIKSGSSLYNIPRISLEDARTTATGSPRAFYLMGEEIHLYPTPSSTTDTLRLHYFLVPGDLVEATDTGVISAINTTTKVVTITNIPSSYTTADIFDFVSKSGAHKYKAVDQTSTLVSGSDVTFSTLPSDLVVGDYLMPQSKSSLVQLPRTLVPVLAQYTAAALLNYAGQPGGQDAEELGDRLLTTALKAISPRVTGEYERFQSVWFTGGR